MARYEYRCKKCNKKFETFVSIEESGKAIPCVDCGQETQKLISSCSFVYKGSLHRDIDCAIGEDAERKWTNIEKRKKKVK